jgi:hypothetical protein
MAKRRGLRWLVLIALVVAAAGCEVEGLILTPAEGARVPGGTIQVTGALPEGVVPGGTLLVNGTPTPIAEDGTWAQFVATTPGQRGTLIVARYTDPDGKLTLQRRVVHHGEVVASPYNYLGTGTLGVGTGPGGREHRWLSINGYCTEKSQGDRYAAGFDNPVGNEQCSGTVNTEYEAGGYDLYIDVPAGRTEPIDIAVFRGNFVERDTVTNEIVPGSSGGNTKLPTTFRLHAPDRTPHTDADNPRVTAAQCGDLGAGQDGTKTFLAASLNEDNYQFLPVNAAVPSWNTSGWWRLCQLGPDAPAGRYVLRVMNRPDPDGTPVLAYGANSFGVLATPASTQRVCDARSDATCPRVSVARRAAFHLATVAATTVTVPAVSVPAELAGKRLRFELWDVAEGTAQLRLLQPTGAGSWSAASFDWTITGGGGASGVTSIDFGSGSANAKLVTVTLDVPATWNPPAGNDLFLFEWGVYSGTTDRHTVTVDVLDP